MKYKAVISFQPIKDDTYNGGAERQEWEKRWRKAFNIVVDYFEEHYFHERQFHKNFDKAKQCLDCFIPAFGQYVCGGRAVGDKKSRRRRNKNTGASKNEQASTAAAMQRNRGCGRSWNSNRTNTKFICTIKDDNTLSVELRDFGQRCEHCTRHYEKPTFSDVVMSTISAYLLVMMLDGIFGTVDNSLQVNYNDLQTKWYGRRSNNINKKPSHIEAKCESCTKDKQCGKQRSVVKGKKREAIERY